MKIEELYKLFRKYPEIVTDSRKAQKNSIFFALSGENFDGNRFAEGALDTGCDYAVISNADFAKDNRYILVQDTLKTLQELANFHRRKFTFPVIAITGTNGKTTSKELIREVLGYKNNVQATIGNFNNHIGVPLTLLSMPLDLDYAIVEMGANHIGEINFLCNIAEPEYGMITNVGMAHLEGFGSFEGVVKTKTELYRFLFKNGGLPFVNLQNEKILAYVENHKYISYGTEKAWCTGKIISSNPSLSYQFEYKNHAYEVNSSMVGAYNFENMLAATCIGLYFNVSPEDICAAIEAYNPENNRSQIKETNINTLLLDAYNANPTSMKAAIDNFCRLSVDKDKVMILGDMLELGKYSEEEHKSILQYIESKNYRGDVILVGKEFNKIAVSKKAFISIDEARSYLKKADIHSKIILIIYCTRLKLVLEYS